MASELLPIFLDLTGRRVLVVGAGPVAVSKLETLRSTGADLRVVAPDIRPEIAEAASAGALAVVRRAFDPRDLDDVWLVIAAAPPDVNRTVAEAARERRVFVNAVDDPVNATAYLGGVVRRDGITLAISSRGTAPGLTGLLREALDAVLPRDLRLWMDEARLQRVRWRRDGVPMQARRPLLLHALNVLYARRTKVPDHPSVEQPCP
ncbi:MAG: bifunctional precorrin-2 dehydrogenase/sirohydrochlorin ferrochelatase [Acidimicrobiia bacterium]|nr:bifunctional precorrin-2 dehydrogenase/sirohydrochlorin ferrochelatase [Acidimicrobiia bacterium]